MSMENTGDHILPLQKHKGLVAQILVVEQFTMTAVKVIFGFMSLHGSFTFVQYLFPPPTLQADLRVSTRRVTPKAVFLDYIGQTHFESNFKMPLHWIKFNCV